jgi:hypothetical protein
MLALSLDNLLFFLLIAAAALFQLLSKAVTKAGKKQSEKTSTLPTPPRPSQVRRAPTESDADRIRKFLEALGQPPSSTPPPPVVRRTDVPPRPLAPVQPPPVIPRAWGLPREQRQKPVVTQRQSPSPEQPTRFQEIVRPPGPAPVTPAFEVHETLPVELQQPPIIKTPIEMVAPGTPLLATQRDFKTDIGTLLGSKSALREVIILREIFGPPRGLEGFDFPSERAL